MLCFDISILYAKCVRKAPTFLRTKLIERCLMTKLGYLTTRCTVCTTLITKRMKIFVQKCLIAKTCRTVQKRLLCTATCTLCVATQENIMENPCNNNNLRNIHLIIPCRRSFPVLVVISGIFPYTNRRLCVLFSKQFYW